MMTVEGEPTGRYAAVDVGEAVAARSALVRDRGTLFMLAGPSPGAVFPLDRPEAVLGRSRSVQVPIAEAGVSRQHARLYRDRQAFFIEDLGSLNGTFVDGQRLHGRSQLHAGSRIQLGRNVLFRFETHDSLEQDMLRQLYRSAVHDPLTRTYNRGHLDDRLAAEISYAVRHERDLAILLVDLDHFKEVNDRWGHPAGDAVLRVVAAVMQRILRPEDVLARYGGEEFCIVARDTDPRNAMILAERLRRTIAELSIPWKGEHLHVTVSVGISCLHDLAGDPSAEELISAADRALYSAKSMGRDRASLVSGA